jgi:spore germination protein (amino acid permease)
VQKQVKENYMISGSFVFFLITASQTGVGVLYFQTLAIKHAGQDAWISIILMGLSLHIIIWMIYKMLGYPAKDVIDLHRMIFGRFLGNAVSLLLVGYFFLKALDVFQTYIEIIQVWVFPTLKTWEMALILICMIYYVVTGGFRQLTGFSFFAFLTSSLFLLAFYFHIQYLRLSNLLPLFNHSFQDLFQASKSSCIIFIGFETILIYFPFLKSPEKNVKWAHFAVLFNTLKNVLIIVLTILYFSQGHLKHILWPAMTMAKIIELSFLQRFEYLSIFIWLIVIIPTICIPIWCCTRIMKKVTTLKPRLSLLIILITLFIAALSFNERMKIDALEKFVSEIGFYFVFAYIPLLFIIYAIRTKLGLKRAVK